MKDTDDKAKQKLEKLFDFFDKKLGGQPCPACGKFSRRVLMNTDYNKPIMLSQEGHVSEIYSLFCDNCYNITIFGKALIDDEIRDK